VFERLPPGNLTYEDEMFEPKRGAPRSRRRRGAKYRLVAAYEGATVARTALLPGLQIDLGGVWV